MSIEIATALRAGQRDGSVWETLDSDAEAQELIVYGAGLGFCWTLDPDSMDFATALGDWRDRLRAAWAA